LDITFQITPPAGVDGAAMRAAAVQAATFAVNQSSIGEVVRASRLLALLWSAAPDAANITSLTLNGGGDLDPGASGVVRAGKVSAT
jgi:hypothetical protein